MSGHEPALQDFEEQFRAQRHERGGYCALQDESRVVQRQPGDDGLPEASGADEGRERGRADTDHRGDPHAREHVWQGERHVDMAQLLQFGQPQRPCDSLQQRVDGNERGNRIARDG